MSEWHEPTEEEKSLIAAAKQVVMRRRAWDEPTAHTWLQKESQRRRVKKAILAKQVIEADELFSPLGPDEPPAPAEGEKPVAE